MKPFLSLALVPALLALASLASRAASKPAPATETTPPPLPPRSVFVIDPKFGHDPFFPKSERLSRLLPKITNEVVVTPPPPQFPEDLRCQGIAGTQIRRIAIVNGKSMEKGEKVDYRLASGQILKATCIEIKETSVILEINGIAKELHLRSDLK